MKNATTLALWARGRFGDAGRVPPSFGGHGKFQGYRSTLTLLLWAGRSVILAPRRGWSRYVDAINPSSAGVLLV